jgi:hypothetical protein
MSWRGDLPAACWAASDTSGIIPVEAESPTDAVFHFTHSSLPIRRRDAIDAPGDIVDEISLRDAVRSQPADLPVLPILGHSGTGKSHLVRWLRLNLDMPETTRVIFVPKHRMSLRGILELILKNAPGDKAADLRTRVNAAVDSFADEREVRLRLRNTLAVLIETKALSAQESKGDEAELRDYLASKDGLPALLFDTVFRSAIVGDDSAIARLVSEKLKGKGAEDKEDAFEFTEADLNLSIDDVSRAGKDAQEIAGVLIADRRTRELAARMLNEHLGPAVSEVFGIGGDDLKDLLVELRLELQRHSQELLLLIEDFSIFQGIQGGLIDAITLVPTQEVAVCPMRVVMAVTTGYFKNQVPDTVKTRTYKVFELEVMDGGTDSLDSAEFVAPYLNAVRVGATELEEAFEAKAEVPNPCVQCPVINECHDAFGEVNGMGLFPFNREALSRAAESQYGPNEGFVARTVLNRVLRPVLHRDQNAITDEQFPTASFARDFASGAAGMLDVEDEAKLERPADGQSVNERRIRLVRFWGPRGGGARNLHPWIHRAFAIPPIDGLLAASRATQQPEQEQRHAVTTPTPIKSPQPRREQPRLVSAVDGWRETGQLEQTDRNSLRRIVHRAVIGCLDLNDGCASDAAWTGSGTLAPSFPHTSVALGERARSGIFHLFISREDTVAVRALRALAWYDDSGSWRSVPGGGELQRLAYAQVATWARYVEGALLPDRDATKHVDPEIALLCRTLLSGAKVLGTKSAYRTDLVDRVQALFEIPTEDEIERSTPLQHLRKLKGATVTGNSQTRAGREELQLRLVRRASISQGGKPLGLDLPRIVKAVMTSETASAPTPVGLPERVTGYVDLLETGLSTLDQAREEVLRLVPSVDDLGPDLAETVQALNELLSVLAVDQQLPGTVQREEVANNGLKVKAADLKVVQEFGETLSRWEELDETARLKVLNSGWPLPVERLGAWLASARQALSRVEQHLGAVVGGGLQAEFSTAKNELMDTMSELHDRLMSVVGDEVIP